MNGSVILFWVHKWRILFSTNVRRSYVEPTSFIRLDFWHVSFGTSVRNSDVEPLSSWWFEFGPLGSWLMSGLFSTSLWLISRRYGMNRVDNNLVFLLCREILLTTTVLASNVIWCCTSERLKLLVYLKYHSMT